MLLPKRLLDYASIQENIILFAYSNRIECWDKELYSNLLDDEPEDFAALAEEIMGDKQESLDDSLSNYRDPHPTFPPQRH